MTLQVNFVGMISNRANLSWFQKLRILDNKIERLEMNL